MGLKKAILLFVLSLAVVSGCHKKPEYTTLTETGDYLRLDTAGLSEGQPHFYSFMHEGKKIDFFVIKGGGTAANMGGGTAAYFDACMKCYPHRLGYRAEGDRLVCRACGIGYSFENISGVGSCYPIRLDGRAEGNAYLIRKDKIIEGERYF